MADDLIERYINQEQFSADTKFAVEQLAILQSAYTKLKESFLTLQGTTGIKNIATSTTAANEAIKGLTTNIAAQTSTINQNTTAQNQLTDSSKKLAAEKAKLAQLSTDEARQIAEVKLQQQQQTKANKEVAQSVLGLVDDYGLLKKQYDAAAASAKNLSAIALRTGSADDNDAATAASAKAKGLHDSLLQIESATGQSQRNVGNYTGALKILEVALAEAKAKLDGLTQSDKQNTAAGQALTKEVGLLSTLTGQQAAGFVSLRRELANSTQALFALEEQGLQGTEAFKELQTEVANGRRELNEFNKQQKLLSSEAPALAGLTAVAKGLGAAYAIGAGASALFANGNEKVEKELNKLVAVMTLLQGLTEINAVLQEKTAISTALLGAKTGILNVLLALKNFILTGSLVATTANTVATEGAAIAEGELAVATTATATSMVVLRAALIATGIGAILVLLGLTASAMGLFGSSAKTAAEEMDILNASVERNNQILEESIVNLDRQSALQLEKMKQRGASQKEQDDFEIKQMRIKESEQYQSYTRQKDALDNFNRETDALRKKAAQNINANADVVGVTPERLAEADAKIVKSRAELSQKLTDSTKKAFDEADTTRAATDLKEAENLTKSLEKKKAAGVKSLQELKDRVSTEFEIYKGHQESKIKLFDRETSDDKVYYTEKLAALDNFIAATKELNDKQDENDIAAIKRQAEREIQHLGEEKVGKDPAQIARINKNIEIIQQNSEDAIGKILEASVDKQAALVQIGADKRQKIVEDQLKKEEDAYKAYEEQKALFEEDKVGDDKIKKAMEKRLQQEKEFAAKRLEIEKELNAAKYDVATKAEDLLFTFATAGFDRQNNLLEDQKTAIDKKAEHDLAVANATITNQQDLAAATIIINARAASQKEILDRKEKENNLKKAKFDQAQQIFEIGISTLKTIGAINLKAAELRAASALNPLLLGLIPLVLSQIPFALASGALSIAGVLAKPLPHLKYGKNNDYEGPAIVGDGGINEIIQRSDGSIYKTPAKDTLTFLGKKDIVFPSIMDFMLKTAMPTVRAVKDNAVEQSFEKMLDKQTKELTPLLQKIANKRENHISAKEGALVSIWKHGSSISKYINENTQW